MAIEYNFTLDMDRSKRDNNIAYARTGDVDSITINADLVLNGAAYTPTGTNAFFECITPNGHSIRAAAEKTGSSVSVEVPSAAFQAAGVINVAYFRFESGSSDNPTYVESTEPFAIVVREGIGNNIDAGDYIEEWRELADHLEAVVAEVEQKAEQAETAINEQKTEVDQLKAQAQVAIAGDVTEVEEAAQSAISAINQEKADVADAAEDVSAAGEQAINTFKTNSQQAINQFNTNGTSAINQFNTKADGKLEEVDGMITEAQGDVNAAITQLEDKTQDAIEAAQAALDGTTATNLQNAINRTLKLDIADMVNIPDNSSLSSFTNVGSYCCKTAATAATVGDCPVDDSPFNMYVFSSATSGQVMQLVVPIDLNGKPTAEWHVRFGSSSAMDPWSVIGGGADIAAGLGIDITGDAKKTVALDTTAFYQHHEAAGIIHGSTEVTGGGRIKELTVYGNTVQNLWVNPATETRNGVTLTANADGSITVSGTSTASVNTYFNVSHSIYTLKPETTYTLSVDKAFTGMYATVREDDSSGSVIISHGVQSGALTFQTKANMASCLLYVSVGAGSTVSGTYRVMLNEGSTAQPWCPPGLNGVDELSLVTAGRNLASGSKTTSGSTNVRIAFDEGIHLNPGSYHLSCNVSGAHLSQITLRSKTSNLALIYAYNANAMSFTTDKVETVWLDFYRASGLAADDVTNIQLELGSTATAYEPPNITTTPIDLDGYALHSLPDGTCDELTIDATGAVTLTKRVGVADKNTDWVIASQEYGTVRSNIADALPELTAQGDFLAQGFKAEESTSVTSNWADYSAGIASPSAGLSQVYVRTVTGNDLAASKKIISNLDGKFLYALATPKEVELPGVSMPSLASPDYTVFATSSVPMEIEAEVVKVDYLHPSDVYTKEEVDKKIEDAGGMPDVVPVSQGGTGATTAAQARQNLGAGTSDFSGDYNDLMNKPDIPEPISTDEIDAVIESGSGTGEQVLNLTGLSYYWTKVKAWAQSVFAKVAHTHQASDITGFTPSRAVVSNSAGGLDASTVTTSELGCLSGVESPLQDQIDTLRDSVSQQPKIFIGSDIWSCNAAQKYVQMWTRQQFIDKFGRAFNSSYDCIVAMNGDADAQNYGNVLGCYYDGGTIGCYLDGHTTGLVRLNYAIFLH